MEEFEIGLEPGHGGLDPGAIGFGLLEKNINWVIANLIKDKLAKYKVKVTIFQPSCKNPKSTANDELVIPVREAIKAKINFLLSIHTNAGKGTGFESYIHEKADIKTKIIRSIIHNNTQLVFGRNNMPDRGKKVDNFYVLRKMQEAGIPAMLIENGFIDNAKDAGHLKDSVFLNQLANEIAYGIVLAFELKVR